MIYNRLLFRTQDGSHYESRVSIARMIRWMALCLPIVILVGSAAFAQAYSGSVAATQDGFGLTKFVSDTVVCSGESFSYDITFSIPAGATNVTITDALPNALQFISSGSGYAAQQLCSASAQTPDVVTTPTNFQAGGTYSLHWNSVPCGATGSFHLNVRFPVGSTCNGTGARNHVCITYTLGSIANATFCTPFVTTMAQAHNSWTVTKAVGGIVAHQSGACPNAVVDSIMTYSICVTKKEVGTACQYNLYHPVVTDVIPTGATLVSSTCNATTTPVGGGTLITWTLSPSILYVDTYNSICCTYTVKYPRSLFPVGSQIRNGVLLKAGIGGDSVNKPCDSISVTDSVCSEIKPMTSGNISKWVTTNGQRGCAGSYFIRVCNNGNQNLTGIQIMDTLPAGLTYGVQIPSTPPTGWTYSSFPAFPAPGSVLFTMSSGTAVIIPGGCVLVEIPFTISATAPLGNLQNCVHYNAAGDTVKRQQCCSFTIVDPAPIPCAFKEVCAMQPSYAPGSTFTYRLRVQNIGAATLTGAQIADILNENIIYVGPVTAYTNSTYNIACGQANDGTMPASSVTLPTTGNNNTITFQLPPIAGNCSGYSYCGQTGTGVPFYFIEFPVKVSDSSSLGTVCNSYTIQGGNTPGPAAKVSNSACISVAALTAYWLEKDVKKSGTSAWGTSAFIPSGGSVDYRLQMNIPAGRAPLRNISFIDELPRNHLPGPPKDARILAPCPTPRGSLFDVKYSAGGPISSPFNSTYVGTGGTILLPQLNVNTWSCGPAGLFTAGCGDPSTVWSAMSIPVGCKNFGYCFGIGAYIAGTSASVIFSASVGLPETPKDTIACNSFGFGATVRRIVSGGPLTLDLPIAGQESGNACITTPYRDSTKMHPDSCHRCDSVSILNWGDIDISQSKRQFTVHNMKFPQSPIKEIQCGTAPTSAWYVTTSGTLPPFVTYGPLVPVLTGPSAGCGAAWGPFALYPPPITLQCNTTCDPSTVQFWLGIATDPSFQWVGKVNLKIIHCDGDTCFLQSPTWCAKDSGCSAVVSPGTPTDTLPFSHPTPDSTWSTVGVHIKVPVSADVFGFRIMLADSNDLLLSGSAFTGRPGMMEEVSSGTVQRKPRDSARGVAPPGGRSLYVAVDGCRQKECPDSMFKMPYTVNLQVRHMKRGGDRVPLMWRTFDTDGNPIAGGSFSAAALIISAIQSSQEPGSMLTGWAMQLVPNPTRDRFTLFYDIPQSATVKIEVTNALGQIVRRTVPGMIGAGVHSAEFETSGLPPGTYFVRVADGVQSNAVTLQVIR